MAWEGGQNAHVELATNGHLRVYAEKLRIPAPVIEIIRQCLFSRVWEFNAFGGDPEMHPDILEILAGAKKLGLRVNLTTTGRKIMTTPAFRTAMQDAEYRPHLIALSADDASQELLNEVLSMTSSEVRTLWRQEMRDPIGRGQKLKFLEAMWVLRYSVEQGERCGFPPHPFQHGSASWQFGIRQNPYHSAPISFAESSCQSISSPDIVSERGVTL